MLRRSRYPRPAHASLHTFPAGARPPVDRPALRPPRGVHEPGPPTPVPCTPSGRARRSRLAPSRACAAAISARLMGFAASHSLSPTTTHCQVHTGACCGGATPAPPVSAAGHPGGPAHAPLQERWGRAGRCHRPPRRPPAPAADLAVRAAPAHAHLFSIAVRRPPPCLQHMLPCPSSFRPRPPVLPETCLEATDLPWGLNGALNNMWPTCMTRMLPISVFCTCVAALTVWQ